MSGTTTARAIAIVFHPLMIPLYVLLLLLNLDSFLTYSLPLSYKTTLAGTIFLTTALFPLLLTWILFRMKLISSVYLSARKERTYPLLAVTVFYYLTYFLLKGIHISTLFSYFMLGATLLAILALLFNYYRKISLHMIGAGSVTGFLIGLSANFGVNLSTEILAGILLSGIIGYSRLKTNSHHPADVYAGFAMGVVVMLTIMVLA